MPAAALMSVRRPARRHAAPLAAAALLAAATLSPATAGAATLSGPTSLTFAGNAYATLAKAGVKIDAGAGAVKYQGDTTTKYVLATTGGSFGKTATVKHAGSLTLRRKTGTLKLTAFQLRFKKTPVLSAKLGGKRLDLFSLDLRKGEYTLDKRSAVVKIDGARANLTRAAATAIGKALKLRRVRTGGFAVLATTTSVPAAGGTATGDTTGSAGTKAGQTGSSGSSTSKPYVEPTALARPATAKPLTAASLRWHVRESFVRYVSSGEGVAASGGATAGAAAAADGNTCDYDFAFNAAGSWYDPASGQARVLFTGTLTFTYSGHGIDIQATNPEVELNPVAGSSGPRVIVTYGGSKASAFTGRDLLVELDPAKADTTGTAGLTNAFAKTPGVIPNGSSDSVFAGFYQPGDEFGSYSLTFTRGL